MAFDVIAPSRAPEDHRGASVHSVVVAQVPLPNVVHAIDQDDGIIPR